MYRTYNPRQVIFIYGGGILEGWENITVKRNVPQAKQVQGIWGKTTKVSNYQNTSATVEITVSYGSETNRIFTELVELDRERKGGVKLTLSLKDAEGDGVEFTSPDAYLEGMPEESWSGTAGSKTWRFFCDSSSWRLSSEAKSTDSLADTILSALL